MGSKTSGANMPEPGVSYRWAVSASQISSCRMVLTMSADRQCVQGFLQGHRRDAFRAINHDNGIDLYERSGGACPTCLADRRDR